ncbi:arrestin domain-containing protein 3-like [Lates japonicus]
MSPIKDFCVTYDAINEEGTFASGDPLSGTVTFTLTKDTKVKCLSVKAKGDARVHWTEGTGDNKRSYSAHRRYFKLKELLIAENEKGTILPKGTHRFKFRFQIPQGDMPSSFKGLHGKIVYMIEVKMSRSWRLPSIEQNEIKFVSRSIPRLDQMVSTQFGSVNKEMGMFSKGEVQMSATANRKVCSPGDTLSIVANVKNMSSKTMRAKFSLQQKTVYRASGSTNSGDISLCKLLGDTIGPNSEVNVTCQLEIPADVIYSLQNCDIVSVDYYVKVYLDISFSFDPEVVFPLIIIPSSLAKLQPVEAMGPNPAGPFWGTSNSDFPPPAPTGPGAYAYPPPVPTQPANISSGYNNPWPQPATQYGFSIPTFPLSSVQHPAPTAPPQFQQGAEPPSYMDLFPPSQDTQGWGGTNQKS